MDSAILGTRGRRYCGCFRDIRRGERFTHTYCTFQVNDEAAHKIRKAWQSTWWRVQEWWNRGKATRTDSPCKRPGFTRLQEQTAHANDQDSQGYKNRQPMQTTRIHKATRTDSPCKRPGFTRLQEQTAHANDQDSSIADAKDENRKLPKEIARMKDTSFVSSGDWNPSTKKSSTSKVSLCARTWYSMGWKKNLRKSFGKIMAKYMYLLTEKRKDIAVDHIRHVSLTIWNWILVSVCFTSPHF